MVKYCAHKVYSTIFLSNSFWTIYMNNSDTLENSIFSLMEYSRLLLLAVIYRYIGPENHP